MFLSRNNNRQKGGDKMSKRGQNIYKRKDGRWEGRYIKEYIGDKIKYGYVYAKTYKEAKAKLFKAVNKMKNEKLRLNSSNSNFRTVAEQWLEALKTQLKNSSVVKYNNVLKTYLYPKFDNVLINTITSRDLLSFNNELLNSGGVDKKGLSPKTVSLILSVLKRILIYASKNECINMPDFSCIYIKQNYKNMRILSVSEQYKLNKYLCENKSLCNVGILVCMYTGIRIGEICALKWKNISLEERCIRIENTMQRLQISSSKNNKTKVIISKPKSDCSVRDIPIPDNLYYILREFKEPKDTFLLTGSKDKFLEPRTLQNRFKAILKNCDIKSANFHSLRHAFATRCVEIGFDVKSLSEILGHSSVNITLNRYVHPSMEIKQKNINMLSDFLAVK